MTTLMSREIAEQPQALASTIDVLRPARAEVRRLGSGMKRVVLFGRGSSDTAATYGRYLIEVVGGRPAAMGAPSVATVYGALLDLTETLVVVCSQSGNTAELVEVAGWAKACGARTVSITNEATSPLAAACDLSMVTQAGHESAVPATKSQTTCMLALAELTAALAPDNRDRELSASIDKVPQAMADVLAACSDIEALARQLADADSYAVTGRGFTYAVALEVALKIQETSAVACIGLSQADLQHGPVAALGPKTPLIVVSAATGPTLPGLTSLARSAGGLGCPVVTIGGDPELREAAHHRLAGTDLPEPVAPMVLVAPGQLLAESMARLRGRDPDRPDGLAKVTQTA
jgi:glucosamine--fructose-6-phosphate aminotransferase (isomerizing)